MAVARCAQLPHSFLNKTKKQQQLVRGLDFRVYIDFLKKVIVRLLKDCIQRVISG